jgi:two-component system LytT family response regulator
MLERVDAAILDTNHGGHERMRSLLANHDERHASHVIGRSGGRLLFVRVADVDWIEAAGNYVRVHARGDSLLLRTSMTRAQRRLDPSAFIRIHRSAIVNIDRIKDLTPWSHGEYIVTLQDGTRLHAGRAYSHRLTELIESCVL